ncbi:MAG: cytochrome D1 domain-containing protein [Thermoguttaceae bacterium]|jgi:WD40 repeat protein
MRSRLYALSVLLATAALAATGKCYEIALSDIPAGNTTKESMPTGNQEAGGGQSAQSERSAHQGPNAVTGNTPLVSDNWEIAATLVGHKDVVKSLAFSPDGKRLFSGSLDGEIKVWEMHTRKELASIIAQKDGKRSMVLAVSPSGDVLASGVGSIPGEVKVWDARTLQLRATLSYPRPVYCIAFSSKSDLIGAAGEHEVYVWSVGDSRQKYKIPVGIWPITGLAFSPDGRVLYVGGFPAIGKVAASSGILHAWDLFKGMQLGEIKFSCPIEGIALSGDGNTLAVAAVALYVLDVLSENDRVMFKERFSVLDKQWRGNVPIFQEQFRCVALSPSQKAVAGAAGSPGPLAPEVGNVALFALHDGRKIARLETPRQANGQVKAGNYDVSSLAFSPDGKLLASGSKHIITIWTPAASK